MQSSKIFLSKKVSNLNISQTNLNLGSMTYGNKPNALVYHHAEAACCTVEDINQWHKENGWAGIGYHYFVRKDGSIYKGRPDNVIGSHCLHHNTNTLGICAEGNYEIETMPQAQRDALINLGIYLKSIYPITAVYGHRDLMATACPGTNYPLDEIKATVMSSRYAKNGWDLDRGAWYYYSNGSMAKSTWAKDSSQRWFYLGTTGAMITNGWAKDSSNRWFYLGVDGAMVTDTWAQDSHGWCYLGKDGAWDGVYHTDKNN